MKDVFVSFGDGIYIGDKMIVPGHMEEDAIVQLRDNAVTVVRRPDSPQTEVTVTLLVDGTVIVG